MPLVLLAFIAGMLTVLAPCILPILPVILGGSISVNTEHKPAKNRARVFVIIGSLAVSIFIFTLLLKATTALLGVPQLVWQVISGVLIILVGLTILFPKLWGKLSANTGIYEKSNKLLGRGYKKDGFGGEIVMGFALGPVFNSCSPTYALIVAVILPASFFEGTLYLIAYIVGLCLILVLIALVGQRIITKLGWLSNPGHWLHKLIGITFVVIGLVILLGLDKKIQTYILDRGWYDPVSGIEERFKE